LLEALETCEWTVAGRGYTADRAGPESGEPVLLLHGFPQTRHTWRHQLPALAAAGYRAIAPDQRGYSPRARTQKVEDYATDRLVADVVDFSEALGGRVHLVGHDWGGQLAWLTAARHPDRVATLTVLSRPHPAAFVRSFALDPSQSERSKHHRAFDDPMTVDRLLERDGRRLRGMLRGEGVPEVDIDAYLEILGERDALEAALHWYRAARLTGISMGETPAVAVPTLYLWGDRDHSVGRIAAEATGDFASGRYRFVCVPGSAHFLTDDGGSDRVTEELLAHLATQRISA
jgi:pimeloyl-ACP methyl ester carboxylesterase